MYLTPLFCADTYRQEEGRWTLTLFIDEFTGVLYVATHIDLRMECSGCFYLIEDFCRAQSSGNFYKPTSEEKKLVCQDPLKFRGCERFKAYNIYLRDKKL